METLRRLRLPLIVLLLILLAACGGGSKSSSGSTPTPTPTVEPSPTPEPTPTPEPIVLDETAYQPGIPASTDAATLSAETTVSSGGVAGMTLDDGTQVMLPDLGADYQGTLTRTSLTLRSALSDASAELVSDGWDTTGPARTLTLAGEQAIDPDNLRVDVVIPAQDLGSINPATAVVVRVADAYVNGEWQTGVMHTLPATVTAAGGLQVTDPHFRDSLTPSSATALSRVVSSAPWQATADYVVMSFQGDLNWRQTPALIRMIPQPGDAAAGYRRPATTIERAELAKKPLCNLVLLVHGHNEEEKGGDVAHSAPEPWRYGYKQLVWELLYQSFTQDDAHPQDCTAFYEYVYPTYRPIFSDVVDASGTEHETLGDALGVLVQQELVNDPQLKAMIEHDMPFNVMMFAHSQGGLVARAGLRQMPQEIKDRMVRFVSWGSPHRGAPLYTLRYAFESGHDMVINGFRLPFASLNNTPYIGGRYRDSLNAHVALDAPGIRDLRWEADLQTRLQIYTLFPGLLFAETSPRVPLFSTNLSAFNGDTSREEIAGGYTFIVGNTSKRVDLSFNDAFEAWYFVSGSTSIQQGATLNAFLMASDSDTANDGAVPLLSQSADGVSFPHATRVINLGDIDHEEFYGAEPAQRTAQALERGRLTTSTTFTETGLALASRQCPTIPTAQATTVENALQITGEVKYSVYAVSEGGDGKLGERIADIELRSQTAQGSVIGGFTFDWDDTGQFAGSGAANLLNNNPVYVVVRFKDGSEISEQLARASVTILPPRIITFEVASGVEEVEERFEASATPEGAYRFVWQFPTGASVTQERGPGETSAVVHVFRDWEFEVPVEVRVLLYDEESNLLSTDTISVTFIEKQPAELFDYDCGWEVNYANLSFLNRDDGYSLGSSLGTVHTYEAGYRNSAGEHHGPGVSFFDREQTRPTWALCFRNDTLHGYVTGWYDDDERTLWYQAWYEDGELNGPEYRYFKNENWCSRTDFSNGVATDSDGFEGQCPWRAANGGLTLTESGSGS